MAFNVSHTSRKSVLPPAGLRRAICAEVRDLGEIETQYGRKHQGRLIFEVDATDPETGERLTVVWTFTVSLHEKSKLREFLRKWMGRELTPAECANFDLEKLIGLPAILQIEYATSATSGNQYAKISSVAPHQPSFGDALKMGPEPTIAHNPWFIT